MLAQYPANFQQNLEAVQQKFGGMPSTLRQAILAYSIALTNLEGFKPDIDHDIKLDNGSSLPFKLVISYHLQMRLDHSDQSLTLIEGIHL